MPAASKLNPSTGYWPPGLWGASTAAHGADSKRHRGQTSATVSPHAIRFTWQKIPTASARRQYCNTAKQQSKRQPPTVKMSPVPRRIALLGGTRRGLLGHLFTTGASARRPAIDLILTCGLLRIHDFIYGRKSDAPTAAMVAFVQEAHKENAT